MCSVKVFEIVERTELLTFDGNGIDTTKQNNWKLQKKKMRHVENDTGMNLSFESWKNSENQQREEFIDKNSEQLTLLVFSYVKSTCRHL